jgi:hypothetical protein
MDARQQATEIEQSLRRAIRLALQDPSDNWLDAPVRRASVLAARAYRELYGQMPTRAQRASVTEKVRVALGAANRQAVDKDTQATLVSGMIASFIADSMLAAGAQPGSLLRWHSMDDDKVRPSHREVDGAEVPQGESFTVAGVEMSGPHDLSAPIEETAGCRCWLEVVASEPEAIVAAAAPGVRGDDSAPGIVIVGLPALDDPIYEVSSEQPPHVTLIYLHSDFAEQADQIIAGEAPNYEDIAAPITGVEELGDEGAQVAMLDPAGLTALRDQLITYEPITQGMEAVEQFPQWTPHATLGYPDSPPLSDEVPDTIVIDRLAILGVDGALTSEYPLGEPMSEAPTEAPVPEDDPVLEEEEFVGALDAFDEVPLYGVLAPEGVATGDGRLFLDNSLVWVEPPLTLRWQEFDAERHDGSAATGRIDRIWREDGLIKFEGVASMSDHGDRMVGLIAERVLSGISVDLDDAKVEFRNRDGSEIDISVPDEPVTEIDPETGEEILIVGEIDEQVIQDAVQAVTYGRIRSAAACAIPAFIEAFIAIGRWADHESQPVETEADVEAIEEESTPSSLMASAAAILAFAPGTEDGPGWLTHPVDTDRLRDYWTKGKGAALIGWGLPGDFNRCRTHLAQYVKPQHLAGYCANRHKDALGIWPGEHTGKGLAASSAPEVPAAPPFTLVASAHSDEYPDPPEDWFRNPNFGALSASVVTKPDPEHGGLMRTYGHLAGWNVCHSAYDECVLAPHSPSGYAHFLNGAVLTAEGTTVATGRLTVDTGHAGAYASAAKAAAHYDNTGHAVADVVCGEDEFGIWFAGYVRPWATAQQVRELRAAPLSGDWRYVNGELDMVAALAVNSPGFSVPRVGLAASSTPEHLVRVSLVAAGMVPKPAPQGDRSVREIVASVLKTERVAAEARAALIARRRERFAAIKSEIGDR